ncbi:MAG: alpha/beta hydrolase [Tetrasphaera sp.]|nr:alpha/beta hydrolase [Tetrasphaera sp.]
MSDDHPVLSASARPPDRTEVTGPAASDLYDVWEPSPGRADRPERGLTLALLHGGFWREQYDRSHLSPVAAALAADGYHVANLEYSRIGMPGGGWPGTGTSVRGRLEQVLADPNLPDRAVVIGHSAGGHLALWLASQPDLGPDTQGSEHTGLVGAVALAPAADLREVHRLGLSKDAAVALLGGTPEQHPEAWADADPGALHVTVPTVVLTGGRDDDVPRSVTTAYREGRQPDERVTFGEIANADHYDLIDPSHEAYLTVLAHLEQLELDLR